MGQPFSKDADPQENNGDLQNTMERCVEECQRQHGSARSEKQWQYAAAEFIDTQSPTKYILLHMVD
jgi:hypothetical protein